MRDGCQLDSSWCAQYLCYSFTLNIYWKWRAKHWTWSWGLSEKQNGYYCSLLGAYRPWLSTIESALEIYSQCRSPNYPFTIEIKSLLYLSKNQSPKLLKSHTWSSSPLYLTSPLTHYLRLSLQSLWPLCYSLNMKYIHSPLWSPVLTVCWLRRFLPLILPWLTPSPLSILRWNVTFRMRSTLITVILHVYFYLILPPYSPFFLTFFLLS